MLVLSQVDGAFNFNVVATFSTVEDAQKFLMERKYDIVAFDEDASNPGHFDVMAVKPGDMAQFVLEPRKLAA